MMHIFHGKTYSGRLQWVGLGIFLAILAIGIVTNIFFQLYHKEKREEERLSVMTNIISKNLAWRFESARLGLLKLRNTTSWQNPAERESTNQNLQLMLDLVKGGRTLNLLNKAGDILISNRSELIGKNFAYREYFKTPQTHPQPDTLYLSSPFMTSLGVFALNLSMIITDGRGGFNGLVSMTLDPEYFYNLLDSVRYAPDVWCAIAHGDGILFMEVPPRKEIQGKNLAVPGSFFSQHLTDGRESTVMSGTIYATGEQNMLAQRTFQPANLKMDRSLRIGVGRNLDAIFKPNREDAWVQVSLFALVALLSSLGLYLHQRRQQFVRRQTVRHNTILDSTGEGIVCLNSEGTMIYVNHAVEQLLGWTPEHALQKTYPMLLSADTDPSFIALTLADGQSRHVDHALFSHRDGVTIPVAFSITALQEDGNQTGGVLIFRDLRSQLRAETRIRETKEELDRFFTMSLDLLCITDMEGRFLRLNPSWETTLGHSQKDLLGKSLFELIHPDEHATSLPTESNVFAGQPVLNFINRFRCRDGDYRWLEWRSVSYSDHTIYGVARDITTRRALEEAMHRSEEKFRQLFQNMSLGAVIYEAVDAGNDFLILEINTSVERIEKMSREQLIGRQLRQIFPAVEEFGLFDVLRRVWETGAPEHLPTHSYTDNRITGWRDNFVYRLASGEVVVVYDDVTENMENERRLHALNEELTQFVFAASHDLQEPLRTMISYAEFLPQDMPYEKLNDAAREDIRFITDAAKTMQQNLQDLLLYSRILRLEFKPLPVDLNQSILIAMENLHNIIEKSGATVTCHNLPTLLGDATTMIKMIQNLLDNALKFHRPGVAPEIRVDAERIQGSWRIQVKDNGIGMEEKYLEQIFQPFRRLHGRKEYPGTGLGLSIARKIVERHGGTLQVTSIPGQGSIFTLILPSWTGTSREQRSKPDGDPLAL
ncbi:MAG: PAS domain S-box protein [Magnetococcales bacterium]|nr:PAS domain S-box protein [Magnetococcales bacterium]